MRFLILNTDYLEFINWLYTQNPGLEKRPYEEQMRARNKSLFGVADFYSSNLNRLGNEAWDIHANNWFMQKAWAAEHGVFIENDTRPWQLQRHMLQRIIAIAGKTPLRYLRPLLGPVLGSLPKDNPRSWFNETLAAQIKHYKPDIILNQAMDSINTAFLRQMKQYSRLLVGQIASPLPKGEDFSCYDLVISSMPNLVEHFRQMGLRAEFQRLAFEPRVLEEMKGNKQQTIPISFVGNLFQVHSTRVQLLEYICQRFEVRVWGTGINSLPHDSSIRRYYMGTAWGIQMYQILQRSDITLNNHIDMAGNYANNCRLYEGTGVGTLLLTDWKENLQEIFDVGKEVIAYRSLEECAQLLRYYLEKTLERKSIASGGQRRTLQEHTYYHRVQELMDIVRKYV
jgi:spore maturation protein CgeB